MIFAGLALAGTPATVPPEDQMMASAMSESAPPHLATIPAMKSLAPCGEGEGQDSGGPV